MQYTDEQAAEHIFGINHSITPRPSKPRGGQENSANGTGPEETCARQGGAISGTACGRDVFKRPYCPGPRSITISRSDSGFGPRTGTRCGAG